MRRLLTILLLILYSFSTSWATTCFHNCCNKVNGSKVNLASNLTCSHGINHSSDTFLFCTKGHFKVVLRGDQEQAKGFGFTAVNSFISISNNSGEHFKKNNYKTVSVFLSWSFFKPVQVYIFHCIFRI